jgi:hypothetical protein
MIKAEQMPDQAIAAFDRAFLEGRQSGWPLDMAYWHAFAAALAAWPGMDTDPNIYGRQNAIIHLPLPLAQEPSNE